MPQEPELQFHTHEVLVSSSNRAPSARRLETALQARLAGTGPAPDNVRVQHEPSLEVARVVIRTTEENPRVAAQRVQEFLRNPKRTDGPASLLERQGISVLSVKRVAPPEKKS